MNYLRELTKTEDLYNFETYKCLKFWLEFNRLLRLTKLLEIKNPDEIGISLIIFCLQISRSLLEDDLYKLVLDDRLVLC